MSKVPSLSRPQPAPLIPSNHNSRPPPVIPSYHFQPYQPSITQFIPIPTPPNNRPLPSKSRPTVNQFPPTSFVKNVIPDQFQYPRPINQTTSRPFVPLLYPTLVTTAPPWRPDLVHGALQLESLNSDRLSYQSRPIPINMGLPPSAKSLYTMLPTRNILSSRGGMVTFLTHVSILTLSRLTFGNLLVIML